MTVRDFIHGFHGVRYQTKDVARSVLRVSDAKDVARSVLRVSDLEKLVAAMAGPGGKQIQLLDPDENPIELFESARRPVQ